MQPKISPLLTVNLSGFGLHRKTDWDFGFQSVCLSRFTERINSGPNPEEGADSHTACEPISKPHAGRRSIVNSGFFSSPGKTDKSAMDRGPALDL